MHRLPQCLARGPPIGVVHGVNPPERLIPIAPVGGRVLLIGRVEGDQPGDFIPHSGETIPRQHHHKVPMILTAERNHRTIRIQPVQHEPESAPREPLFGPPRQTFGSQS